ncbi:hypothetical protein CABS02_15127 [Colletotrichum abscissum]|uniref:Uncharacterized protein n=2 Tax=Colletotrichum acutatum species complex TaxID=2707335 RepID=A0A9P9X019_9PEZI|nr:hypothetical protein CABS02_15127 [Colletotrichum abscissum]KAK0369333.1 hypothetical protein CLIM01_13309 [Colletotrichum limetticola]
MATAAANDGMVDIFNDTGSFYFEDEHIGRLVQEVDDLGLSASRESWKFFANMINANPTVRQILQGFLESPNPYSCHTFGPEPLQVFCFWPKPDQSHRLVLSLWSPGTRLVLYQGAHKASLKAVPASNGLFEVPGASLKTHGSKPVPLDMPKGGM